MLEIYIASVVLWFVVLKFTAVLFQELIVENGWIDVNNVAGTTKRKRKSLLVSFIPIVRLFVFAMMLVMAVVTKKEFEEFKEGRIRNDKN